MPKIIIHEYERTAQYFIENLGNGIQLEMVMIPSGSFMMGSPETEEGSTDDERPQHQVTIKAFCLGKYQVTQAQWKAVAAFPQVNKELKLDPSRFKGDGSTSLTNHRPVEQVSWENAVEFCDRLSRHTKRQYRLPSEAEWEYACRAGTTTPFHFGETITTNLANYQGTDNEEYKWSGSYGSGPKGVYREETTAVGSFGVANNFGLYDMHGNVWEWCQDDWHSDYEGAPTDGSAWLSSEESSDRKLLRGGSWDINPGYCRSAYRIDLNLGDYYHHIGFRVVCSGAART
jgi:formylglycine-generating enzyme required for sulfatase activity